MQQQVSSLKYNVDNSICDIQSTAKYVLFVVPALAAHVVGLVYNYRNSLSEDFTGDAKNVL